MYQAAPQAVHQAALKRALQPELLASCSARELMQLCAAVSKFASQAASPSQPLLRAPGTAPGTPPVVVLAQQALLHAAQVTIARNARRPRLVWSCQVGWAPHTSSCDLVNEVCGVGCM
ncbi:hypothetical protein QJQ45_017019 [Haematococcus lacustris]|nr:hypothetical protein QJQ45_017019 [Haematococcus lacustris]